MNAPSPANSNILKKEEIYNDLDKTFKEILIKHLDERAIKEDKIYSWMNNILTEAKEYFIKKYPDYDLFLYNYICSRNVYFNSNQTGISIIESDGIMNVCIQTDNLYSILYYFFYKCDNLDYSLDNIENEIIKKGNVLLSKYLNERKYIYDKVAEYNKSINDEHVNFIFQKENYLRCFVLNEIYQNPIKGNFYFKYLSYGKEIYLRLFQTYTNDSLTSYHIVFFFK